MNDKPKKLRLEISESGLKTIIQALESYSRLGMGQFKYAFECLPEFFNLSWEDQEEINKYLQSKIRSERYGIYHPKLKHFCETYEIKKEIEKRLALNRTNNIREGHSTEYYGALDKNNKDFLPIFLNDKNEEIQDCVEFLIPELIREKLAKLAEKKDFNKVWELIDKYVEKDNIRGNRTEIAPDFSKIIVYEPYRLSKENL